MAARSMAVSGSSNQINFTDLNGTGPAIGPALSVFQNQFYTAYQGTLVSTNLWEFPFTATWNG